CPQKFSENVFVNYLHLQSLAVLQSSSFFPFCKISLVDSFPGFSNQLEVKRQILNGCDLTCKQFLTHKQMPQVCLTMSPARICFTVLIDGRKIIFPLFIAHIEDPCVGINQSMAGIPGWQNTVKHINP